MVVFFHEKRTNGILVDNGCTSISWREMIVDVMMLCFIIPPVHHAFHEASISLCNTAWIALIDKLDHRTIGVFRLWIV